MSEHDRTTSDDTGVYDLRWVSRHRGNRGDFIERHRRQAFWASDVGLAGLRELAPDLFDRVSNERTLRVAFDHLKQFGGRAPGVDGQRIDDISDFWAWEMCRALRDEIRAGEYQRLDDRIVSIPKGPGRGFREIAIPCVEDRVVERAVVEIVQPLLNPLFDDHSFGYRPKKGRLRALALAERYLRADKRRIWITQDIRDAFGNVPVARVLQIFRKYLPADNLAAHVSNVVTRPNGRGLRQGGPLSPLLLNLYLHHLLDLPWRQTMPGTPLIRVADDLLILCRTQGEARRAHEALHKLLTPAGMPLKFAADDVTHDLGHDGTAEWVGYRLSVQNKRLAVEIADHSWESLAEKLARSHVEKDCSKHEHAIIKGWVSEMGPCRPHVDRSETYGNIVAIAKRIGIPEILPREALNDLWQRAYARWRKLRTRTRRNFDVMRRGE